MSQKSRWWLAGLGLAILRIPYFLTLHVQEDAYITFRCARNLATSGILGYNLPERVSATTSYAYTAIVTLCRLVAGDGYLYLVHALNTVFLLSGTYLFSRVLVEDEDRRWWLWVLLSISPLALFISYSGMETSFLILMLGLALLGMQRGPRWLWYLALFLLPWIRPDAIAFVGILLTALAWRDRRIDWIGGTLLLASIGAILLFNQLYFGHPIHQTIHAKRVYQLLNEFPPLWMRIWQVLFGESAFSPIRTRFFRPIDFLFGLAAVAICAFALWNRSLSRGERALRIALVLSVLLVPIAYAYGGTVFSWYLWPSALLYFALALQLVVQRWSRGPVLVSVIAAILALDLLQWAISFNVGNQEGRYRAGVGLYLREHSSPDDVLFLEPAGYIPYFAERTSYDSVGLTSPEVTRFAKEFGPRYWLEFVRRRRPDVIIERCKPLSDCAAIGNDEERAWLDSNYHLTKTFEYKPSDYFVGSPLQSVLRLGSHSNYYVYRFAGSQEDGKGM